MSQFATVLPDGAWMVNPVTGELVKHARHEVIEFWGTLTPLPAGVKLKSAPTSGENPIEMTPELWACFEALNPRDNWKRNNGGVLNSSRNRDKWPGGTTIPGPPWAEPPMMEGLTAVGNVVEVLEVRNGAARIRTFRPDAPPDLTKVNPQTHPWLFCRFTSINKDGEIGLAPDGVETWFPLLSRDGHNAWVPLAALKFIEKPTTKEVTTMKRAKLLDISHHKGNFYPDKALAAGFIGVGVKISEGAGVYLTPQQRDAIQVMPVRFGYAYLRSNHKGFFPLEAQVETYLEATHDLNLHFHAVDFERSYYLARWEAGKPAFSAYDNVQDAAFAELCRQAFFRIQGETGKYTMLYSNPNDYQVGLLAHGHTWMRGQPYWCAQYPYYNWVTGFDETVALNPETWTPRLPAGQVNWAMWQFSDKYPANGITDKGGLDTNVWNGTEEDLLKTIAAPDMPDFEEIPDDPADPDQGKIYFQAGFYAGQKAQHKLALEAVQGTDPE